MRWIVAASALLAVAVPLAVQAQGRLSVNQLAILDGRAAEQYTHSERLQPPRAEVPPELRIFPAFRGTYTGPFLKVAKDAAQKHNIPEDLFLRLVQRESGWNPAAVSSKGALGLAQLMPQTAQDLGVNPHDPVQNLDGGARYLRRQFEKFGDWRLALAAYNAGPGAVEQYGGVPPYAETQAYVAVILGG